MTDVRLAEVYVSVLTTAARPAARVAELAALVLTSLPGPAPLTNEALLIAGAWQPVTRKTLQGSTWLDTPITNLSGG